MTATQRRSVSMVLERLEQLQQDDLLAVTVDAQHSKHHRLAEVQRVEEQREQDEGVETPRISNRFMLSPSAS